MEGVEDVTLALVLAIESAVTRVTVYEYLTIASDFSSIIYNGYEVLHAYHVLSEESSDDTKSRGLRCTSSVSRYQLRDPHVATPLRPGESIGFRKSPVNENVSVCYTNNI